MAEQIASSAESLQRFPATQAYFFDAEGAPLKAGTLRPNPDYAATLKLIAEQGAKVFYEGEIAQDIVKTVNEAPTNAGSLSLADLANYTVKERSTVCMEYRAHDVCGMQTTHFRWCRHCPDSRYIKPFRFSADGLWQHWELAFNGWCYPSRLCGS